MSQNLSSATVVIGVLRAKNLILDWQTTSLFCHGQIVKTNVYIIAYCVLFQVGNDFSIADLSVYPRVAMSDNIGMPITEGMFPNICKYKRHLESRACFKNSLPRSSWFMGKVLEHCRPLMVWLGNKRSGIDFTWFDASKCTLRFDITARLYFYGTKSLFSLSLSLSLCLASSATNVILFHGQIVKDD